MASGLRVNYEIEGEGPAVLLLHGWGGCIASMRPIRETLARDHRVISVDLPGFGGSEMPPEVWGSERYAECVRELLAGLGVTRLLAVVGHSFGGKVALYVSLQQPGLVGSLVLVGTPGVRLPASARTKRRIATVKVAKRVARVLPGAIRRAVQSRFERLGSEDYRNAGAMRPILVRVVNEDLRDELARIDVPTLLVWGALDDAAPVQIARIMEGLIPGSGLVVLERSGHFPYLDEPGAFAAVLSSFVASMRGRAA
jgi:pimeloyl-ACP methyl ester carboxylesterase